mgnify:FL=1
MDYENSKTIKQFNLDVLQLLGLSGRGLRKLTLTIEAGKAPLILAEEVLVDPPGTVVTKSYQLTTTG